MWKSRWEEENGEAFFLIVFVHVRAKREMSEIQINVLKYKRQVNPYGTFLSLPFPKIELVLFYTIGSIDPTEYSVSFTVASPRSARHSFATMSTGKKHSDPE